MSKKHLSEIKNWVARTRVQVLPFTIKMFPNTFGITKMAIKTENILTVGSQRVKDILPLFEACQMVFSYTPLLFSVLKKQIGYKSKVHIALTNTCTIIDLQCGVASHFLPHGSNQEHDYHQ